MSHESSNKAVIIGGVLGGVFAPLAILALVFAIFASRRRKDPVPDGKGSPRSPAWGIPVIFAGRDGGGNASEGKAPPSPIKNFKGFEDSLPVRTLPLVGPNTDHRYSTYVFQVHGLGVHNGS
jgi:hypothetical protein